MSKKTFRCLPAKLSCVAESDPAKDFSLNVLGFLNTHIDKKYVHLLIHLFKQRGKIVFMKSLGLTLFFFFIVDSSGSGICITGLSVLYCRETFLFDLLGVSFLREERNSFHVKGVQSPPVTDCCLFEPNYMQWLFKGSAVKKACVQMISIK